MWHICVLVHVSLKLPSTDDTVNVISFRLVIQLLWPEVGPDHDTDRPALITPEYTEGVLEQKLCM